MPNLAKQISSKEAWAQLTQSRDRYKFAFIAAVGLLYKSGQITKEEVVERLNAAGVTREDLRKFRAGITRQP